MSRTALACLLTAGVFAAGPAAAVAQQTFSVNSTGDAADANVGDETCDTGNTVDGNPECTIRAAIQEANSTSQRDDITFDGLDSGGLIAVGLIGSGPLPDITEPVDILGNTAPGTPLDSTPSIDISGDLLSTSSADGLTVAPGGAGTFINLLSIVNFPDSGIEIDADDAEVADCYLGMNRLGNTMGNRVGMEVFGEGVLIIFNVVSGNTDHGIRLGDDSNQPTGQISDNIIGLNPKGSTPVPNGDGETNDSGIFAYASGSMTIESNVIAGNDGQGLRMDFMGGVDITNNYIGTNRNLEAGLGNQFDGIQLVNSSFENVVDENVIVDNGDDGIDVRGGDHILTDNYIGVTPGGTPIGNTSQGIVVDGRNGEVSSVQVGVGSNLGDGSVAATQTPKGTGNVIGGNGADGVLITNETTNIVVRENYIGTTPGNLDVGNGAASSGSGGDGIRILANGNPSENHVVGVDDTETPGGASGASSPHPADGGRGNVIAYNSGDAVSVGADNFATGVSGVSIRGNTVYQNGDPSTQLGIDLGNNAVTSNDGGDVDTGPNQLQNFPVIENVVHNSSASTVDITYRVETATSNAAYPLTIDFYAADSESSGEGKIYLARQSYPSDDAQSSKTKTIDLSAVPNVTKDDDFVATATDANGNTSEFLSNTSPLPIELAAFEATQAGEGTVELTWETASETGNAGFRVQHRTRSDSGWTRVGFVESTAEGGTTTETRTYHFTAENLEVGTHQFRLRQIDLDGSAHVHDPATVELRMEKALRLSGPAPNPVRGQATVAFAVRKRADTRITLYNTLGQKVRTLYRGTPPAGESQTARIETGDLASGAYFLHLQTDGASTTRRLTVVQ